VGDVTQEAKRIVFDRILIGLGEGAMMQAVTFESPGLSKTEEMLMSRSSLCQRQVHLDFHTSPAIPDVGADFDARAFARTMRRAHVNSVTVFAKCHHGHLYYNTKHPARHPGLRKGFDLLVGQVEALHGEGIRAPIYISVQCDEFAANAHPEWIALNPDNTRVAPSPLAAGWQILDMSSPYVDYLADQTAEVLRRFKPVDGLFFDMCWNQPSVSRWAIAGMTRAGLDPEQETDRQRYAADVSASYMERLYRLVRRHAPKATVHFNSRPLTGLPRDLPWLTHVEIEALPTGGWGYLYFPKNVRYVRQFPRPYMGMTARFHKSWADFGGLKPDAALKYEVCQMLAHGAACSIGDQLHPRGSTDRAAYDLIGRAYAHAEACEPWTDGAVPVTQIGVFRAVTPGYHEKPGSANDGVVRMLTQLKLQFDLIDPAAALQRYELLVLPDEVAVDAALVARLRRYIKGGGKLLLSGTSGLDANLKPLLPEAGVRVTGHSPFSATYLRFGHEINRDVPPADHVMYERGLRIQPGVGATVLARVVEPYFERSYRHFSSHQQTPARPRPSAFAAAVRCGNVISIAYPVFKAYAAHGNIPYRLLVRNCIDLLLTDRLVDVQGPSTLEVTVMKQARRTIVHFLQFVAERRTQDLDIVEDVVPLHDVPVSIRTGRPPRRVYLAPSGEKVPFTYAAGRVRVIVPRIEGHQMLVVE
jgi:hypothetical protein